MSDGSSTEFDREEDAEEGEDKEFVNGVTIVEGSFEFQATG